ncbi:hypothetical protein Ahy_B05g076442 [Arachis hypogaea]|uniref:Protein kinase domain-containing protein n=1 Tax=Arachis hypogaea TaxID=3818 RepID=A0A444Z377_ARAHY|nr:hypothetical protein Ahy_B05g076442 [Arachis hypogaea]
MEQYKVLEKIGKGAFGSALLVKDQHEKKNLAGFVVAYRINLYRDTIQAVTSFAKQNKLSILMQEQMIAHLHMKYRTDIEGLQQQEIIELLLASLITFGRLLQVFIWLKRPYSSYFRKWRDPQAHLSVLLDPSVVESPTEPKWSPDDVSDSENYR